MMKMGPQSAPERCQNKGIFTWLLDEVENGSSKPFVFLMFFILPGSVSGFWVRNRPRAPIPWISFERQAVDLGVFLEIASRNHQTPLGFNWYFERGDDGNLDSKRTRKHQWICRVLHTFPRKSENVIGKVSINHWYVWLLGAFSRKSLINYGNIIFHKEYWCSRVFSVLENCENHL